MSILADTPLPSPVTPVQRWRPTFRQVARLIAAFLAVLLVGGGIGWLVYVHHYQPVRSGSVGGIVSSVKRVSDGLGVDAYLVVGPPGTVGTMVYSIANDGPFDITVTGPEPDAPFGLSYRWGPIEDDFTDGASEFAAAKALPVTVKAHQQVKLFVSVTKPNCSPGESSAFLSLPIAWKALGVHHQTQIWLGQTWQDRIAVCFEPSALRLPSY